MRWVIFGILIGSVFGHFCTVYAETQDVVVSVTGSGPTTDEAKTDAIRQALQQTLRQLVVVDRTISGNKILRDKVMSTMNGYVEAFCIKQIQHTNTGFSIDADITVSASRIENFIGVSTGGGGSFEGTSLLAEQNRRIAQALAEKGQERARGEIFDRVLRGFPSDAIVIRMTHIALSEKDPKTLVVDIEYKYKPSFVKALVGTIEALSICRCAPRQPLGTPGRESSENEMMGWVLHAATLRKKCVAGDPIYPGLAGVSSGPYDVVCVATLQSTQCYQLEPGAYLSSCNLEHFANQLGMFGRFVDESGKIAGKRCIVIEEKPPTCIETSFFRITPFQDRVISCSGFDLRPGRMRVTVSTDDVDLQRAKKFVAIAFFRGDQFYGMLSGNPVRITNIAKEVKSSEDGCDLLDDAVRYQLDESAAGDQ